MEPTRIFDLTERIKNLYPDKCALACKTGDEWKEYSGNEYYDISNNVCCGLIKMGYTKGEKILTISNNRPEWNFVDIGMSMAGLIHVPVYTSLSDDEFRYIVDHSDASMVIVSDAKFYTRLNSICKKIEKVKDIFTFDKVEGAKHWSRIVEEGNIADDSVRKYAADIKKSIQPGDLASIIYTSGTTGNPKGVMLSHDNLVKNFLAAADVFRLTPEDRFLSILPLCHVGGRLGNYQTQYSGTSVYYAENMGTIARDLKNIQASGFDAVPRVLEKIYDNVIARGRTLKGFKKKLFFWAVGLGLKYKPFGENGLIYATKLKIADRMIFSKWREALGGKARLVGCGGASLQPRLERIFWASGLKILNMYGLTETSPIITINRQHKGECMLGSVGALIDGVEARIEEDGEIVCRGHNVMLGYYKDDELSRSAFTSDGWFKTGDVGHFEKDKFLVVTDRKKEIFKLSSGKFIAPQLIENRLKESVFIDQVMVIGEHEKFASAIIVPDQAYLKDFGKTNNIGTDIKSLVKSEEVIKAINEEVKKINSSMAEHEKIVRIRIVADQWSPSTGELSASLKLKRRSVESKYSKEINNIYRK